MNKKLVIVLVPILVLMIALIGVLGFLLVSDDGGVYTEQLKIAQKYLEVGDYESAILYYRSAITEDKTQEEPYIRLAQIYYYQGKINDVIATLKSGYINTGSLELYNLLLSYQDLADADVSDSESKINTMESEVVINSTLVDMFATYTYQTYSEKLTVKSEIRLSDTYIVTYSQYDVDFEYRNTPDNSNVLDESTGLPNLFARPTSIRINDISALIPAVDSGVTVDDIVSYGITSAKINPANGEVGSEYITFEYRSCSFTVACDSNGTILATECYNSIVPPVNEQSVDKVNLSGKVVDVTTGSKVANTTLVFREGYDVRNGSAAANCVATTGEYSIELAPGEYTVEVSSDNYTQEFFNITLPQTADYTQDFSISPILAHDQIRIVLEWGNSPSDLDSHLTGTSSNGTSVDVNFTHKREMSGLSEIASLDVDDMDGFGPETITLSDINGNYAYRVHRYTRYGSLATSGAIVKVYTGESSQPIVISVPADVDDEWWEVFTIEDGNITGINGVVN